MIVTEHRMLEVREVRNLTGATSRQIRHWIDLKILWPAEPAQGRGFRPRFSFDDVNWITLLLELTELGVSPARIMHAAETEGVTSYVRRLRHAGETLGRRAPWWLD